LTIQDHFEGNGLHRFEWFFHVAPGIHVESRGSRMELQAEGVILGLIFEDTERKADIEPGWYSPSYGLRQNTAVIRASCERTAPLSVTTRIYVMKAC
jgi:Heparinase II/III-like protein